MAIPSIAMIPSGYKASKLYSVLPTDGGGDLTVVRSTTATRVNSSGVIEEVLANVPRLDYSDGGCPSLLVEPQSTNLLLRSEEFDNAYWVKNNATVTANAAVSPDGNTNADKLVEDTANSTHRINPPSFSFLANTNYTYSFFAKAGERTSIVLHEGTRQGIEYATINLINGNVTLTGVINTLNWNLIDVKTVLINGFYRVSVTASTTVNVTASFFMNIRLYNGTTTSYLGDGTSGIYIWGAQLEALPYATSYIPTVASTVTRNADVISKTGISDLIGQTEGTLFAEFTGFNNSTFDRRISISDGSLSNRIFIYLVPSSSTIWGWLVSGGLTQANISTSISQSSNIKFAISYQNNLVSFFVNGVKISEDLSATMPIGLSRLGLDGGTASNPFYGKVKNLQLYKTALSDQECINLTTI